MESTDSHSYILDLGGDNYNQDSPLGSTGSSSAPEGREEGKAKVDSNFSSGARERASSESSFTFARSNSSVSTISRSDSRASRASYASSSLGYRSSIISNSEASAAAALPEVQVSENYSLHAVCLLCNAGSVASKSC